MDARPKSPNFTLNRLRTQHRMFSGLTSLHGKWTNMMLATESPEPNRGALRAMGELPGGRWAPFGPRNRSVDGPETAAHGRQSLSILAAVFANPKP